MRSVVRRFGSWLADACVWLAHRFEAIGAEGALEWFSGEVLRASRELGVEFTPRSPYSTGAHGACDDLAVLVTLARKAVPAEEGRSATHLCISITGARIPKGIAFAPERGTGDDVLTGDTAFDDMVEVRGEPSVLLALLDREIRQRVGEFVRLDGRLKEGRLSCCLPSTFSSGELVRLLRLALWLARELSSPGGGVCERLARNAKADPHPGVRLWNLSELHERFPATPEARDASQADLEDGSPWVRLAAARFLKEEGLKVLEHLALDRTAPVGAVVEAVALVAARCPIARAGPLLLTALKTQSGEARRQAVEELGRIGYKAAGGPLMVLLERGDPRTAAAAVAALARLQEARAERSLLKAMETDARELRLAVVRGLGVLGTAASVEPLLAFQSSRRLDGEMRQAVRDSVDAIQSRIAGAEAGQLSLAGTAPESGWLSVARPGAGEGTLSLVPDEQVNGIAGRRANDP